MLAYCVFGCVFNIANTNDINNFFYQVYQTQQQRHTQKLLVEHHSTSYSWIMIVIFVRIFVFLPTGINNEFNLMKTVFRSVYIYSNTLSVSSHRRALANSLFLLKTVFHYNTTGYKFKRYMKINVSD